MLIQRNQTIEGLPAVEARSLMRLLEPRLIASSEVASGVQVQETAARELLDRFVASGHVRIDEEVGRLRWTTTIRGAALAKARIGKPMGRAKAQRLLDGLVARAREINDDAGELYWVELINLYGSFADSTRELRVRAETSWAFEW